MKINKLKVISSLHMKYAHFIALRIFCYEEDDEELIRQKLLSLFPGIEDKKKPKIKSKKHILTEDRVVRVLSIETKRPTNVNKFLKYIFSKISETDKNLLLEQIESRLDEGLHFYLRLDKENFLGDKYELTEGGNCLHIRIAVAAYPHKREIAMEIVQRMIFQ